MANMDVYKSIEAKIISYFSTNWTYTSVQYPNVTFDPNNLNSWAQIHIIPISRRRLCLGGNNDTGQLTKGTLVVNLFTRQGTGTGVIKDLVTHAMDLFNYAEIVIDSGETIHFEEARSESGVIDGNFWKEVVKCNFLLLI